MRLQMIFGIIVISLIAKQLESKALNSDIRVKRDYAGYGGNEYDSTIPVSSGVLQYGKTAESSNIDSSGHYDSPSIHADPWKPSGLSPSYEVWLEPSSSYHPSSPAPDIHASITTAPVATSNSVFSDSSDHSAHYVVSTSQLHTQIIPSSEISVSSHGIADHSISTISDNIDFNNVSDIKSKHYAKSYGK